MVLYEMLTGNRLFEGETVSDTLAQVLTKEPDFNRVPVKVRRLLRSCLEKDPKKRLRDIGDAWELLEAEPATTAPSRSRLGMGIWIAAAAVLALVAAGASWIAYRATRPAESEAAGALEPRFAELDFCSLARWDADRLLTAGSRRRRTPARNPAAGGVQRDHPSRNGECLVSFFLAGWSVDWVRRA